MSKQEKMRTYRTIKHHLKYEKYLNILNRDSAKALTKLRVSAHNLAIERGRYTRPPTPRDERKCPHCPDDIQDEKHFLLSCTRYDHDRQTLFNSVITHSPAFASLSLNDKFLYILNAEGNTIHNAAKFIYTHLP